MLTFDAETAAFLNRVYAGRDTTRRRHANLDALAPRPGETIVDLGCGNGMLLPELHRAMNGEGRIVGVDMSTDMLAAAAGTSEGLGSVELSEGDALAIPLPDGSADGIVSIQVFEYIADLPAALAECARVLRPGGRLVIGDIHFDSLVWGSDQPGRMAEVLRIWDRHLADRAVPEKLPGLLPDAGFTGTRTIPVPITDFTLRSDGLAAMMLTLIERFVAKSELGPEAARAWAVEQTARAAEGNFFFSLTHYVTLATRV